MKNNQNYSKIFSLLLTKIQSQYNLSKGNKVYQINSTIAEYLKQKKVSENIQCVSGYVLLDKPINVKFDEHDGVYDPVHLWIKIDSNILDFTSVKFNGHLEGFIDQLFFYGQCESYKELEVIDSNNEWTNHDLLKDLLQDEDLNDLLK